MKKLSVLSRGASPCLVLCFFLILVANVTLASHFKLPPQIAKRINEFCMQPQHYENPVGTLSFGVFYGRVFGIDEISPEIGDEIAAIDKDGIICGVTVVGDPSLGLLFPDEFWIKVYGDDENTEADEGAEWGETVNFKYWDKDRDKEYLLDPLDPYTGQKINVIWTGDMFNPPTNDVDLQIIAENHNPEIVFFEANPDEVRAGEAVNITAQIEDEDNDPISYEFSCQAGGFSKASGELSIPYSEIDTTWTAPNVAGTYEIFLEINDGRGGIDKRAVSVSVITSTGGGGGTTPDEGTPSEEISTVPPGQTVREIVNEGTIENLGTIEDAINKGVIRGGKISGTIINKEGTLEDVVITKGTTVEGGELKGTINNQGTLKGVTIDAFIENHGLIEGTESSPIILKSDAEIKGGEIEGVIESEEFGITIIIPSGSLIFPEDKSIKFFRPNI